MANFEKEAKVHDLIKVNWYIVFKLYTIPLVRIYNTATKYAGVWYVCSL